MRRRAQHLRCSICQKPITEEQDYGRESSACRVAKYSLCDVVVCWNPKHRNSNRVSHTCSTCLLRAANCATALALSEEDDHPPDEAQQRSGHLTGFTILPTD